MIPDAPMEEPLAASLESVSGIGPARRNALKEAGISTVSDLLWYLPFRYEDRTQPAAIRDVRAGGAYLLQAEVKAIRTRRTRRRGLNIVEALLSDSSGSIHALWFNQPYLERALPQGSRAFFYGQATLYSTRQGMRLQMDNPEVEKEGAAGPDPIHSGRVVPVYRRVADLGTRALRSLLFRLLEKVEIPEVLPSSLVAAESLIPRAHAFRQAHFPAPGTPGEILVSKRTAALSRLIFEELFCFQMGLQGEKSARGRARGVRIPIRPASRKALSKMIPFTLTGAQKRVLREVVRDISGPAPMYRLIQGDVGSGKTIVAFIGMALAAMEGFQAAFLAPTEILAYQQYERLARMVDPEGYRVVLLTAALKARERKEALGALASGEARLAVGTHALFQEGVDFANLGMVVVDEQHRFGVEQRAKMMGKGANPHVLVMSATPIPRSLAMTLYGDLDLSVIDELPPGRQPVVTAVRTEEARPRVESFLRSEMDAGRQIFVVYPLVEESEKLDLQAATEAFERLRLGPFRGYPLALLHGRMATKEKQATMSRFRSGEIKMLIATSIIEVGVDLPEASVILVEHSERFGLAQLHQLRGRVGRGGGKGYCILIPSRGISPASLERLQILEKTRDGFDVAEADLRLRGAGDAGGIRQWGGGGFKVANPLRDFDMLERARTWAERLSQGKVPLLPGESERMNRHTSSLLLRRGSFAGIG